MVKSFDIFKKSCLKGVVMEEKERYTIESFEIEEPSVIFDNKTQQIILTLVDYNDDEITHLKDLLNHYFKRIKELEEENKVGEFWHSAYQGKQLEYDMVYVELRKAMDENQQLKQQLETFAHRISDQNEEILELKQQLHELPKKIVEEIKRYDVNVNKQKASYTEYVIGLIECLDAILKKYGG